MAAPTRTLKGSLRTAALFVGALLFLFEEWLWIGFTRFFEWLGRFGLMRWLDARMVRLPPVVALITLCVPMAFLFPFKIIGLWMIGNGRFLSGCLVMLTAKVVGTAVVARIFLTCRPQLLTMPWFARLYAWTGALRDRIHAWMELQPAWHEAKHFVRASRRHVRAWMRGTTPARSAERGPVRKGALLRWRSRRKARREGAAAARAAGTREASQKTP